MDGMDAWGRMVSLLNYRPQSKLPPLRLSESSRPLGYSTQMSRDNSDFLQTSFHISPVRSPPQLTTIDSSTSQGTMDSPSPVTPTYPFEPLEPTRMVDPYGRCYQTSTHPARLSGEHTERPEYPLSPSNDGAMEDGYDRKRPRSQTIDIPSPPEAMSPLDPPASSKGPPKKNKYPCPHAQRCNCADTFTTSGHAARHGKKHTGEKNILCPDCSKAFTRKDNMKQHQRTHQSRREPGTPAKERDEHRRAKAKPEQQTRVGRLSSQRARVRDSVVEDPGVADRSELAASSRASPYSPIGAGLRIDTGPPLDYIAASLRSPSDRLDALATAASGLPFSPGGTSSYQSDDCMVH